MALALNENLDISPAGLKLIEKFEGWYPKAYQDPVGVWTIGYGTTGTDAVPGRVITREQGDAFLHRDLREAEDDVKRLVKVQLTQYQFDACVSFVYNLGAGAFARSTMLKLLNRRNYQASAAQFARFVHAQNRETGEWVTLPGLVERRHEESALFLRDTPIDPSTLTHETPELTDPAQHTGGVQPGPPTPHPFPLKELVAFSDTFKAIGLQIAGFAGTLATTFRPVLNEPLGMFCLGVVVTGIVLAILIKYRDIREGR